MTKTEQRRLADNHAGYVCEFLTSQGWKQASQIYATRDEAVAAFEELYKDGRIYEYRVSEALKEKS